MAAGPTGRTLDRLAVVLAIALLVGGAAGAAGAQPAGQIDGSPFAASAAQVDADAVLIAVDIRPDGTADWRIEYRVRLDDAATTEAFESLQADVAANESAYVDRFEGRMAPTVQDAAAATGREMRLRNASVRTTTVQLPQTYGVLAYTFEWTRFAAVEGDTIEVGDALTGLFLDADSALLVAWPDGYEVADVSPPPTEQRDRSVIWRGPIDFGPGEPALVLAGPGGIDGGDTSLVGLAVVLAALLGGGALWWWRRGGRRGGPGQPRAGSADADREVAATPEELLSNEERVIALLESHGGRMKQQTVVEELGWTEAKTSQVVGKLRESGRIEGFRLGRENVLRLPSVDEPLGDDPAVAEDRREA